MSTKKRIYAHGSLVVALAASSVIAVNSLGGVARVYEWSGYPNLPGTWELIAEIPEGTAKVVTATAATNMRVEADVGGANVEYGTSVTEYGAKNGSTVSAVEYVDGKQHTTVLTLTATPVTITDDAGVAQYGGCGKIYDFPLGVIGVRGCVVSGSLTLGTTGTITNTYAGGVSVGSVTATTGATLTGTEADMMAEVDVAAATAKVAAVSGGLGGSVLNGSATAKDAYLNFVIDDDATHTSGTGTFTGTVTITWQQLGQV